MKRASRKILLIGLDAATFELIKPWASQGLLPVFNELMKRGTYGFLKSTVPPQTPPAWTSALTGKNPGKHNIFDFSKVDKGSYDSIPVNSTDRKSLAIWNILSRAGYKVGVFNVPMTFPPEDVNGFMVCGFLAPSVDCVFTSPRCLKKELLQNVKGYRASCSVDSLTAGNEEAFLQDLYLYTEKQEEAVCYLYKRYRPDFFIVVLFALDTLQHYFWRYMDKRHPLHDREKSLKFGDAILKYYQRIDRFIKRLLAIVDEETVVCIISDHGAGSLHKELGANKYLESLGLLSKSKATYAGRIRAAALNKENIRRAVYRLRVGPFLTRHFPQIVEVVKSWRPMLTRSYMLSDVDWPNTKAYFISETGIRINLKGRDPWGIIEFGNEYETLRQYICSKLLDIRDPETGEYLIRNVYRREEVYWGDYVKNAPDLVVLAHPLYIAKQKFKGELIGPPSGHGITRSGGHRQHGIFIICGKHVKEDNEIFGAQITDITPTLLYLFGEAIPEDMDGKALIEAFDDRFRDIQKVAYRPSGNDLRNGDYQYTKEEEEGVKKRLRDLGYMD